jgi:hypothetical protein
VLRHVRADSRREGGRGGRGGEGREGEGRGGEEREGEVRGGRCVRADAGVRPCGRIPEKNKILKNKIKIKNLIFFLRPRRRSPASTRTTEGRGREGDASVRMLGCVGFIDCIVHNK